MLSRSCHVIRPLALVLLPAAVLFAAGCGGDSEGKPGGPGGGYGGPGGGFAGSVAPGEQAAAVPVEVLPVESRPISTYIETNGALEAENEVDIVARTSGPVVELLVEEGMAVDEGQLLARIDDVEYRAQLEISRVTLNETRLAFERAERLQESELISPESFEQAESAYDSARAQFEANRILLGYTEIRAPFKGLIIVRYINFAEQLAAGAPLFRVSDFDPLLCPIRVPEKDLAKLRVGQRAYLTLEPFPTERFDADVLRISPVVDPSTGTIKVTLEVATRGKLSPGMFARVFVETATKPQALVVPKAALSLESIGDTIYVVDGEVASRREVELGFSEGDFVEIVSGAVAGEPVVVVGQDGLSDGTPVRILGTAGAAAAAPGPPVRSAGGPPGGGRPPLDLANMTPEQLERARGMMRSRGMTDEQIEERIRQAKEQAGAE
jgi:RND family efflux transporter MFP subunit